MSDRPLIICVTPVKNEAWILEIFLSAASLWADHIVIADQNSDDGSREIAQKFSKVILVDNNSADFNEPERQRLLLTEARKIPGKKLIVALDADEILSAEALEKINWQLMFNSNPGTAFGLKWPLIDSSFKNYWLSDEDYRYFIFFDDGSEHVGQKIHSPRIPILETTKKVDINGFVVMHYQFTDWQRMQSKHRWYQCYERINFPQKNPISLYRMYHHMYNKKTLRTIPDTWFNGYINNGIDVKSIQVDSIYRWDNQVEVFLKEYGKEYFKYIDLIGHNSLLLTYLAKTQKYSHHLVVKIIDNFLKIYFKMKYLVLNGY